MNLGNHLNKWTKKLNAIEEELVEKRKHYQTLFPIDRETWLARIKDGRCPICENKLHKMWKRPMYQCKSVKHKSFLIGEEKLKAYKQ